MKMAGEPALPRLRRKCRRRSGARATPRWSAERRTSRLRGTGTPRKREVASYRRDDFKVVRLPALRRPLISGSELQLTPRIWARARRSAGRCSGEMRWRQSNTTRQPGHRKCAAGTRRAARSGPCSGLFDIVKQDGGGDRARPAMRDNGGGGGSGIRTHDTVSRIHAFQASAFSHSAIPPGTVRRRQYNDAEWSDNPRRRMGRPAEPSRVPPQFSARTSPASLTS